VRARSYKIVQLAPRSLCVEYRRVRGGGEGAKHAHNAANFCHDAAGTKPRPLLMNAVRFCHRSMYCTYKNLSKLMCVEIFFYVS